MLLCESDQIALTMLFPQATASALACAWLGARRNVSVGSCGKWQRVLERAIGVAKRQHLFAWPSLVKEGSESFVPDMATLLWAGKDTYLISHTEYCE